MLWRAIKKPEVSIEASHARVRQLDVHDAYRLRRKEFANIGFWETVHLKAESFNSLSAQHPVYFAANGSGLASKPGDSGRSFLFRYLKNKNPAGFESSDQFKQVPRDVFPP